MRFLEGNSNLGDAFRLEYGDSDEQQPLVAESLGGATRGVQAATVTRLPATAAPVGGAAGAALGVVGVSGAVIAMRRRRRRGA